MRQNTPAPCWTTDPLVALRALARTLSRGATLADVTEAILQHAQELLGATAGVIYRLDRQDDVFITLGMRGYPPEVVQTWTHVSASAPIPVAEAVRTGRVVIVASPEELAGEYPLAAQFPTLRGTDGAIGLPLLLQERAFGAVGLRFPPGGLPTPADEPFLMLLADLCAQALERARLMDEVHQSLDRAEREIRERRASEQALQESEERLRTLGDHLPHGAIYQVMVTETGGRRFLHMSAGVESLFGVPVAEVLADAGTVYSLIHPDDAPHVAAAEQEALLHLSPYDCEFRSRTRSGETIWVRCCSAPRRTAAGAIVWDGVVLEVTAQRQAEEERRRFEFLVENSPDFIGISDLELQPIYVNPAGLQLAGLENLEAARAAQVTDWFFPEDRERIVSEFFPHVLREGYAETEVRFRHFQTGAATWMTYSVVSLRDAAGRPTGYATISRNIDERIRIEKALRDADRAKDEFLATLAHELRNPLAGISNSLFLLNQLAPDDSRAVAARRTGLRQTRYLTRLVDDLLDVSRITRGLIDLQREPVDLRTVVAKAIEDTRVLVEARQHELSASLSAEPLWVEGDALRLEQVAVNLLSNAVKYTEYHGRIEVTAEQCGAEVRLHVRDNGIGIAAEMLPRLFELFTQAERSHARTHGGLGIGLHLVRQLVELHRGTVRAASGGPQTGSVFTVTLPAIDALPTTGPSIELHETPRAPRSVLIVEDDGDAAETLKDVLELAGHTVVVASSGPSALTQAAAVQPDVILCDIGLPGMDGYAVVRELRRTAGRHAPRLIALTGFGGEEDRERAWEAGFDAHLTKPVDLDELLRMLRS